MDTDKDLTWLVRLLIDIINPLLVLIVGLALLSFFWGLVKFISKAGDAKEHESGKQLMIWGLVAIFIMVSIYGIIGFFFSDIFGGEFVFPTLPV